jgi:hypothetical protein
MDLTVAKQLAFKVSCRQQINLCIFGFNKFINCERVFEQPISGHAWPYTFWSRHKQDGSWNREHAFEEDEQKQKKFFGSLLPNCKAGFIARHKSSGSHC